MEVIKDSPLQIIPLVGQINFPKHSLTFVVKATIDISNNKVGTLADEQLLATADEYYSDDENKKGSLYYASDFSCYKPRADILLSGKCYAPNSVPRVSCPVSLQVGNYKKSLSVYGNRYWKNIHLLPKTTDPEPFTKMDLRYERSFGGLDYALNPIGRGTAKVDTSSADNVLPVPNIQDPNNPITSPFDKTTPAGFLPLQSHWKQRQAKLGTYDKHYMKSRWPWFPKDFDWSHFNAAPNDQQIEGYLRGDEKLIFENLHRKFSTFETQLPGIRPRCFTRKQDPKTGKRYFDEVIVNLDTLWVDMEKQQLVLVWRGWTDVLSEDFDELKHVFLTHESMHDERASIETCYQRFKQAQLAEESEFSLPEETPEIAPKAPKKKTPGMSGVASLSALPALAMANESKSFATQMDIMLAKFGLKLDDLPPEVQADINAQQEKLSLKLSPGNEEQVAKDEQAEVRQQLKESMAKLDLDIDNLPELTPEAQKEKARFFEEFGLSADSAGTDQVWTIFAAALPKMGMSAENLGALLESSDPQFQKIKEQLKENAKIEKDRPQTETGAEAHNPEKSALPGESYVGQDLSGQNFSDMDLSTCDFSNCILTGANFSNAMLQQTKFEHANLSQANFEQANLDGASFENADLKLARLSKAICNNTLISNANFEDIQAADSTWIKTSGTDALFIRAKLCNANFTEANLAGSDFDSAELVAADFSHATLENATFEGVEATNSNYFKANITGLRASQNADFSSSNFFQCKGDSPNFMSANLQGSNLSFSEMPNANFDGAKMQTANLSAANLKQARFIKANLANCKMIQVNLMQSTFERANLYRTDLRGSNCYEVEFLNAELSEMNTDQANLAETKLAYI